MMLHRLGPFSRSLRRILRCEQPGHPAKSFRCQAMSATGASTKPVVKGVVFDMDGTVTIPCIDFKEMRRRCGLAPEDKRDILDVINSYDAERRAAAYAVIAEIEDQALVNMKIMPGAQQLCSVLDQASIPRGLITRNVKRSVAHFHEEHITRMGLQPFVPSITRECDFAYKPSPQALLHICSTWGISPSECVMVGDSVKDDIVSGNRAGSLTVLLDLNGMNGYRQQTLIGEMRPSYIVHSLTELHDLLSKECELVKPPRGHAAVEVLNT